MYNFCYILKDFKVRSIALNVYGTEKAIDENGDGTLYGMLVPTHVDEMEELILFSLSLCEFPDCFDRTEHRPYDQSFVVREFEELS